MNGNRVEDVLKLQQEFEAARAETIRDLVDGIKSAHEQLKILGYDGSTDARPKQKSKSKKPCSRCGAKDHDARFHRGDASRQQSEMPQSPDAEIHQRS
jgi:hypothetical protein